MFAGSEPRGAGARRLSSVAGSLAGAADVAAGATAVGSAPSAQCPAAGRALQSQSQSHRSQTVDAGGVCTTV